MRQDGLWEIQDDAGTYHACKEAAHALIPDCLREDLPHTEVASALKNGLCEV